MRAAMLMRSLIVSILLVCFYPLSSLGQDTGVQSQASGGTPVWKTGGMEVLEGLFGGLQKDQELLPPEKAFTVQVRVKNATTIVAQFKPAKGYYLYKDRINFRVASPATIAVDKVMLPKGEMKPDPTFGNVEVFHTPFEATVQLKRTENAAATGQLHFGYQGCSDQGVCYPPIEKTFDYALPAVQTEAASQAGTSSKDLPDNAQIPTSYQSQEEVSTASFMSGLFDATVDFTASASLFEQKSLIWVMAGFFLFGILLSLTPCVWPMFPILSGIIAGQGAAISKRRAFWLSAAYVLGMAVTYAGIGVAAGMTGLLLSTALQTPWALGAMALLFVVLALSMFGYYELQLPSFLQSRLQPTTNSSHTRSAIAVFAMGSISAVIVGSCIAAPLAAALLYIGQSQDAVLGGAALFALAMGKGVPLLIVGTSLGSFLPRSGPWMESIKHFLGVLLLAAALWTVSPFLPMPLIMGITAAILITIAVYLRALDPLPVEVNSSARTGKGIGIISLLMGATYLVGAVSQSQEFLRPFSAFTANAAPSSSQPLSFERIKSVEELESKLHQAKGRNVMLDFYADWCVSCKEMEHYTFSDPAVRAKLQNAMLLQADVTKNSVEDKKLLARFGLFGPPGILFFDRTGQEIKEQRVIGFMDVKRFIRVLDKVVQ